MDQDRIERAVEQNTKDIQTTAVNVASLLEIVKSGEERYKRDRETEKDILQEIRRLGQAVADTRGLEKEMGELKGEVGKLRHDVGNALNALGGLPILKEKLDGLAPKVDAMEKTLDQNNIPKMNADISTLTKVKDEATGGVKVFSAGMSTVWTIIIAVAGLISFVWGVYQYFDSRHTTQISPPASIEITDPK